MMVQENLIICNVWLWRSDIMVNDDDIALPSSFNAIRTITETWHY